MRRRGWRSRPLACAGRCGTPVWSTARRLARISEIIEKAKDGRAAPIRVLSWVRKALDPEKCDCSTRAHQLLAEV